MSFEFWVLNYSAVGEILQVILAPRHCEERSNLGSRNDAEKRESVKIPNIKIKDRSALKKQYFAFIDPVKPHKCALISFTNSF